MPPAYTKYTIMNTYLSVLDSLYLSYDIEDGKVKAHKVFWICPKLIRMTTPAIPYENV